MFLGFSLVFLLVKAIGVGLRPLACWDCGFESHRKHGCLSVLNVEFCQSSLRRDENSSRAGLPTVMRSCVWSRNLVNDEVWPTGGCCAKRRATCILRWGWSNGGMLLAGVNRNTGSKPCLSATLSTKNNTWTDGKRPLKANSHMPCRGHAAPMPFPCYSPAMPCRVNSHMPYRAPAILRQCRVLRESPCGSRKYPNC
jgi:hypothetical protein